MVDIVLILTVCADDAEKYIRPILLIYKVEKFVMIIEKNHKKTTLDDWKPLFSYQNEGSTKSTKYKHNSIGYSRY